MNLKLPSVANMSLLSSHSQTQNAYEPTLWANLFHSAPHVNITFHPVDSRFNPESDLYLEALGILASIPAAWLITTLVILLIYLCTRCCDTKNTKKRRSRPIRCFLSFLALATCATLALGIWGTFAVNEGMVKFQASTMNINNIVERSQDMAEKYNHVFQNEIEMNLNKLYDGPFSREIVQDRTAEFQIKDSCEIVFNNISTGLEAMDQLRFSIQEPKDRMSFQHVPHWAASFEKYRFPGYFGIQGKLSMQSRDPFRLDSLILSSCFVHFVGVKRTGRTLRRGRRPSIEPIGLVGKLFPVNDFHFLVRLEFQKSYQC